jgi:hypothetical protein
MTAEHMVLTPTIPRGGAARSAEGPVLARPTLVSSSSPVVHRVGQTPGEAIGPHLASMKYGNQDGTAWVHEFSGFCGTDCKLIEVVK